MLRRGCDTVRINALASQRRFWSCLRAEERTETLGKDEIAALKITDAPPT